MSGEWWVDGGERRRTAAAVVSAMWAGGDVEPSGAERSGVVVPYRVVLERAQGQIDRIGSPRILQKVIAKTRTATTRDETRKVGHDLH